MSRPATSRCIGLIAGSSSSETPAAAVANSPYAALWSPEVSMPCSAVTAERSTPQACAAASFRRSRADAAAAKIIGWRLRTRLEPPVAMVP
jgi:hypothetical protein